MRLWTIDPSFLDRAGLVACWREALLAKAVLEGKTKGYKHHPQLDRFREAYDPVGVLNAYLYRLFAEAHSRGYKFNMDKIGNISYQKVIVTSGQLEYEWKHFLKKAAKRNPEWHKKVFAACVYAAPSFIVVPGPIEPWEKVK